MSSVDYYRRRAKEYERVYDKPERQDELKQMVGIFRDALQGKHVLEVACGTGWWSERVSDAAESWTGVDAAPETLEIARGKEYPKGNVRFVEGDAFELGEIDGTFDAAYVGFLWSHIQRARWQPFAQHLIGRLEPGSPILVADNTYVEGSSSPIVLIDGHGDGWQDRKLLDGSVHRVLKNYPTDRELIDVFGTEVEVTRLRYYWVASRSCQARTDSPGPKS